MSESFLSFSNSETFRKQLLVRNLPPYNVPGAFSSQGEPVNYETNLSVYNVVDSPNNYVSTNLFANEQYPLNEYGPDGGFSSPIGISLTPVSNPNQGPYYPNNGTVLDLVNEFYIESAYVTNKWGPSGGYKDLVIITDLSSVQGIYQPYWDPGYFNYSLYPTFNIIFQDNPVGSSGTLSQDSFLAQIGASQLKFAYNERVSQEINQTTVGLINLDTLSDPFSASQLATGQQPFIIKNWKITVPENPALAAVGLANRITGTYFPVSFIPGDYFNEINSYSLSGQVLNTLNTVNNLTGGLLGPILNKSRNPSEIFVANTGNGTRSALFAALNYNHYRPAYNIGLQQGINALTGGLLNNYTPPTGLYYVGSRNSEPSLIDSPPNQVPFDQYGKQQATIVYGNQELSILYEGNEEKINFGLKGKPYSDGGGITGQLVWTSPKYKNNAGFKATPGGGSGSLDDGFNQISADYLKYQSTDISFKPGSLLYNTQQLINSADHVQGQTRLKHVGNAINQVSKVFNDGYKELTKGSRVLSYKNQTDGTDAGIEYCRIFQKDTPYLTYNDLQKTDGITNAGRRMEYSVFDNTYNLNIAPIKNPGSTNIADGKVKKYMLSIENLAWRTSDRPGYTYDELPVCEKGPNGGRIMWFPPYNLTYTDTPTVTFDATSFLGRPEPIYTYKNSSRSGSIGFTIIVDHPAAMNTIIEKQLKGIPKEKVQSIVDSFFAGCVKYDLYTLAAKYNQIPVNQLYTYQEILNNPRLTQEEQLQILESLPVDQTQTNGNQTPQGNPPPNSTGTGNQTQGNPPPNYNWSQYEGLGFYFENDVPGGPNGTKPGENKQGGTSASSFDVYYNQYIGLKSVYNEKAPRYVNSDGKIFESTGIPNFFSEVVEGNFTTIQKDLIKEIDDVLVKNGGSLTIDLIGSASAPQEESYNQKLSERRIDSVKKWFSNVTLSDGKKISQYGDNFKINNVPQGEVTVIPQTKAIASGTPETNDISVSNSKGGDVLSASINCNVDSFVVTENGTKIPDQTRPNEAQWYSIPAMACRRVAIQKITATINPKKQEDKPKEDNKDENPNPQNILTATTQSIKPQPKKSVEQKIKDGISKKILRNLFSECDYFEVIKQTDPFAYDSIREQIKYFSPAFHSMTPEGLNSRLTFLNQCTRPGQTIPVIGPDGRPKYNDALNTSFGAPPVLIIRVGDFYHCKAVPTSITLSNKTPIFDINPEGIGLQPMMVDVTIGFQIIGGMGLKGPVEEVQNALSFNYYANTEVYDERATATDIESTSKNDKYVVEKILSELPPVTKQQQDAINNTQPQKGGSTIGKILNDTEMDYSSIYDSLQTKVQEYFKTSFEGLQKLNTDYSFGAVQLYLKDSSYKSGKICELTSQKKEVQILGKSNLYLELVEKLKTKIISDVESSNDPIYDKLDDNIKKAMTAKQKRELIEKLKSLVSDQQTKMLDAIKNNTANIIKVENELNYIFRQLDVVSSKLDGELLKSNEPKLYDLSGDTFFNTADNSGSIFSVYTQSLKGIIDKYNAFLKGFKITDDFYDKSKSIISNQNNCTFSFSKNYWIYCSYNRFGIYMTPEFTNQNSFIQIQNSLTDGTEIKSDPKIVEGIKKSCENFKLECEGFQQTIKQEYFEKASKSQEYVTLTTWKLPDNTIKKCNYTTNVENDKDNKSKTIKNLYSKINLNDDKKTFNGKVTLN